MNEHVFVMWDTLTDWVSVVNGVIRDLSPCEQDQRLGYIGEEYKDARRMLLQNLSGSSAYRHSKEESREND